MIEWLAPLSFTLAETGPSRWFFRDDDAGWDDVRLLALADVFRASGGHVDVAAIPAAVSPSLGRQLWRLAEDGCVSVHQHGWTHANHEPHGRKCEFGPSRSCAEQQRDLLLGRAMLSDRLGGRLEPFFTPPWNRCTDATASLLARLGFHALLADVSAPRRALPGLTEIPVCVDWTRSWRQGGSPGVARDLAHAATAARLDGAAPVIGVMLHHAVMCAAERAALRQLLGVLHEASNATLTSIATLVDEKTFTAVSSNRHGQEGAFTHPPNTPEGRNRQ